MNILKFKILVIVTLLLGIIPFSLIAKSKGPDCRAIFNRANVLYESGNYTDAASEYEKILSMGLDNGNIYYNIGNSYFKAGNLGRALQYYWKSKELMPRDPDLESNLAYAESLVKGNLNGKGSPMIFRKINELFSSFTVNELTVALSVLYIMVILMLTVRLYGLIRRRTAILALAVLLVLIAVVSFPFVKKITDQGKQAVLLSEKVEAKFEPFERATTYFTIYEGAKVRLLSFKDKWCKVRRSDDKVGWIAADSLGVI